MVKLLFLGFWVLFCIGLADGILCSHCDFQIPGKHCDKPRWSCKTRRGVMCYKETLFYGTRPLSYKKGCRPKCKSMKASKATTHVTQEIKCCANQNYCNR